MLRIRNILVPTDFNDPAEAARRYAGALAAQFKSRIHLLHIVATPFVADPWGTETLALRMADFLAQTEDEARARLLKMVPRRGALAGRVEVHTDSGAALERILDAIKRHRIDLVVMGTHGRGPVGHWMLGSVAERLVRHSPVPVLTIHGRRVAGASPTPARPRRKPRGTRR